MGFSTLSSVSIVELDEAIFYFPRTWQHNNGTIYVLLVIGDLRRLVTVRER